MPFIKMKNPKDIRTVQELISAHNSNSRLKYIIFWGHTQKHPEQIDKSCFSNWFFAGFNCNGNSYPTTEHFMMAEKARLFHDSEMEEKILQVKTPAEAKKFGRLVKNFDQTIWEQHRFEIVVSGNFEKFNQNPNLCEYLVNTGSRILVEASPRDRIWGIGMGKHNPKAEDPSQWRGQNLLGFALMEARTRLIEKATSNQEV